MIAGESPKIVGGGTLARSKEDGGKEDSVDDTRELNAAESPNAGCRVTRVSDEADELDL